VNNAIASMLKARNQGHGRGGVVWQTQGSGKSLMMVFFAQKVLRKVPGNWTFVVTTDRVELDNQIAKTFKATGAVSEAEGDQCHAASGLHLRELLRGNHRYVFTLIHKFQTPEMLCDRPDVIVLTDEAHRSQYDALALNMRAALPKALFLAFTGTPLIAGEERTKDVFWRLRLHLRLPAVRRRWRDRAALLREPHAGASAREPGPEREHLRPDRSGRTRPRAGGEAGAGIEPAIPYPHPG
jgi:type I site-specific restriction-modification system R (restriction) subunit